MAIENEEYEVRYINIYGKAARKMVTGWSEETAYLTFRADNPYIPKQNIIEIKRKGKK